MYISVPLMVGFLSGVHGHCALSLVVVEPQFDPDPVQTHLLYMAVKTALAQKNKL